MSSATDRLVKWEEEIRRQDYAAEAPSVKARMLKEHHAPGSKKIGQATTAPQYFK